ncbi:unnamed protein product [Sphagnum jensenii]|uniref:inositol-1,3,4-trisphosphate 5/6-kinase n=1 Tax=Sphagnum jensenii TaxID=128206 RepID=A0ABP1ATH3_9BRYO
MSISVPKSANYKHKYPDVIVLDPPEAIQQLQSRQSMLEVAKPLVADGTAKSHAVSLSYDKYCLTELDPPLVLQEFVNHGSVLFKVCIVGDQIRVAQRFSLPDVQEGEDICSGVVPFQRVSSVATADEADLDPQAAAKFSEVFLQFSTVTNICPAMSSPMISFYNWSFCDAKLPPPQLLDCLS